MKGFSFLTLKSDAHCALFVRNLLPIPIAALLVTTSIFAFLAGQASATTSSTALDGSNQNGCGYVTSCSVSLTTTQSSDVIVVGCDCWPNGAAFTVKDTAGLSFFPRTVQVAIGGGQFIQTWYAVARAPLSGDNISVVTQDTGETWYGVI